MRCLSSTHVGRNKVTSYFLFGTFTPWMARRSSEPVRVQPPQQARSIASRKRLLDAVITCIVELGYARTTTTAIVLLLVGTSTALSWVLAYERIPQAVAGVLLSFGDSPVATLLVINAMLLVVGTVLDMTPAVLIFTPMLLPVV